MREAIAHKVRVSIEEPEHQVDGVTVEKLEALEAELNATYNSFAPCLIDIADTDMLRYLREEAENWKDITRGNFDYYDDAENRAEMLSACALVSRLSKIYTN